jgi:hypothetical protein
MYGSRVFFSPVGSSGTVSTRHTRAVVPIAGPFGVQFVPFNVPVATPMSIGLTPALPMSTSTSHHGYDFVTLIILTQDITGTYQILMPTSAHSVVLNCRRVHRGHDPDVTIRRMIDDYGLTHTGKVTMLRHVDYSTNSSYKICVVYAPVVSSRTINHHYRIRHHHASSLQRFVLPAHRANYLRDKFGASKSIDDVTGNIIYAVANVRHTLV